MPFFSPPAQVDDAGLRVTEDALDRWSWPEAGEAVGVPEVSVCVHPAIMPDFQTPAEHSIHAPILQKCRFPRFVYPLTKEKSHFLFLQLLLRQKDLIF
jgi:hypothetical protein